MSIVLIWQINRKGRAGAAKGAAVVDRKRGAAGGGRLN